MAISSISNSLFLFLFGKENEVFLSFNYNETGKKFSDHLHSAISVAGFRTFTGCSRGNLALEFETVKKEIERSRISVVVFSKDFASSSRCLDELVTMMEARDKSGLIVLPIFYHVDPSELRWLKGRYGEAFAEHENRYAEEMERVGRWKAALSEVSYLHGMVLRSFFAPGYDVFLSFRGGDTRLGFTDHLYLALTEAGFRVFRDDKGIPVGQNFEAEIKKAIQESKASIVVFSAGYASSKWCLEELVMIMERRRNDGHGVVPIFYEVGRYEVAEQTGRYEDSFAKHEERYGLEKVEQWRGALRGAAQLDGKFLNDRSEGEFVKEIVAEIKKVTQAAHPYGPFSLSPRGMVGSFQNYFFFFEIFVIKVNTATEFH